MSFIKEYGLWFVEKYGDFDEFPEPDELDKFLEEKGEIGGPTRIWEFATDYMTEAVEFYDARPPKWDAFISYAGTQRSFVVAPIAKKLRERGLDIWYDRVNYPSQRGWPGRLYGMISDGVAMSRVGVVFVSPEYLRRRWPPIEYAGLQLKGYARLFFVLHRCKVKDLRALDPDLPRPLRQAGINVAYTSRSSNEAIADRLAKFIEAKR